MTSYLNDSASYARDLTDAAEAGDWERYRNIQAQLAAETTSAMLNQAVNQAAQAEAGKKAAIATVSKDVPGFKEDFYGSSEYQRILTENATLGEAVLFAEQNLPLQHKLPELYRLVFRLNVADQLKGSPQEQQSPQQPPLHAATYDGADERLSSSESRKKVIAELESKGIADNADLFGKT